jgi:DNA polymerase III alpha subunit
MITQKLKAWLKNWPLFLQEKFYLEIQHHGQPADILLNSMVQKLSQETGISYGGN